MSTEQFMIYLTWAFFLLLFGVVTIRALRQPVRTNVDIALLFSAPAIVIAIGIAGSFGLVQPGPIINAINAGLVLSIPYLTLRLVEDFGEVPLWLRRSSAAALALLVLGGFVFAPPRPVWFTALQTTYFVGLEIYAAIAFAYEASRTVGVTRRRLRTVAIATMLLGLAIVASSLRAVAPWVEFVFAILALLSSILYFIGFVPPLRIRQTWQEPELRAFLKASAVLPRLPDLPAVVRALERGAATSVGASTARVGLWDERSRMVRFLGNGHSFELAPTMETVAGRAFLTQQPILSANYEADRVLFSQSNPEYKVRAVLAAPLTIGEHRFGVLAVGAPKEAIFASSDLDIVELVAAQAASVLESRMLIEELARIRAREEAARLKDDFLSAAAHDLKTPLTTLVAQAQYLERRVRRHPDSPVDLHSVQLLVQESQRLRALVLELLDAARAEKGQLVGEREPVDLVSVARAVCDRVRSAQHTCIIDAGAEALVGMFDRARIQQLFDHLIDNAIKFSPSGGEVRVTIRREADEAHISVSDQGIGIPPDDLPHLFERFFRGSNVDDRTFAGMGLSLFICHAIAEQHGGRIWVQSQLGQGTTFFITLPLTMSGGTHEPV